MSSRVSCHQTSTACCSLGRFWHMRLIRLRQPLRPAASGEGAGKLPSACLAGIRPTWPGNPPRSPWVPGRARRAPARPPLPPAARACHWLASRWLSCPGASAPPPAAPVRMQRHWGCEMFTASPTRTLEHCGEDKMMPCRKVRATRAPGIICVCKLGLCGLNQQDITSFRLSKTDAQPQPGVIHFTVQL